MHKKFYSSNWFLDVFFFFFFFFKNKTSFKIAMSGRVGVGQFLRFTVWLTFFQTCMLLLFFSGLLSYLVGMKRRTSTGWVCRPQWLSWMRRPTGDQKVAGSTPAEVGNILSWRLIMKYFLQSFSPFCWFEKGSCQFLAKECAQYLLTT